MAGNKIQIGKNLVFSLASVHAEFIADGHASEHLLASFQGADTRDRRAVNVPQGIDKESKKLLVRDHAITVFRRVKWHKLIFRSCKVGTTSGIIRNQDFTAWNGDHLAVCFCHTWPLNNGGGKVVVLSLADGLANVREFVPFRILNGENAINRFFNYV